MTIKREDAINAILTLKDEQNEYKVNKYIQKIHNMSEEEWKIFIRKSSINTIDTLYEKVEQLLNKKSESNKNDNMIVLNELIKYGYDEKTLHIHTVINDAHNMLSRKGLEEAKLKLIDALEKIEALLQENTNLREIEKVYAISPILRRPIINMFEELDFDTKVLDANQAKEDEEFKYFYKMFTKGNKEGIKKLGRASISKEKLLSRQWNELKDKQKSEIEISDEGEKEWRN